MTKPLALTEDEVLAIREQYDNGHISQAQLADDYGVSEFTINHAIRGKGSYAKFTNVRVETEAKEADMTIDKGWLEAWQKSVEDELVKMRRRVRKVETTSVDEQLSDLWSYCDRLSAVFMDVEAQLGKQEEELNTRASSHNMIWVAIRELRERMETLEELTNSKEAIAYDEMLKRMGHGPDADADPEPAPCPWCGVQPELQQQYDLDGQPYHIVKCESCEAQGPFSKHSGELVVKRWNRVARGDPHADDG